MSESGSDVATILRVLAKYAWAAADELAGTEPEKKQEPDASDPLAEAKKIQAERHAKLGKKSP